MNFGGPFRWTEVSLQPETTTGGPFPAIAEAGKPFYLRYHRGLSDLGTTGEISKIRAHYRVDGGAVKTKLIADGTHDLHTAQLQRIPAKLTVPNSASGEVEYWFEIETKDGRRLYDSDFGANYRVPIAPRGGATLRFDDLWGEAVSGPIRAGETMRIAYDVDRLKQFLRGTFHHGAPTWSVQAFISFDGKAPSELPLLAIQRGEMGQHLDVVPYEAAVKVPEDAHSVRLWFRGSSYGGSVFGGPAWDSDHGANYTYPVER